MDSDPPRYNYIKPPIPTEMNIPLQPQGLPLTQQTAIVPYMAEIPGIPPGLAYLTQIDQVVIREKFSSGQKLDRHYDLLNNLSQRIFLGHQEVQCFGPIFHLHILDNNNTEVVELLQQRRCTCTTEIEVQCPPGTVVGYSIYNMGSFVTSFSIMNAAKQIILVIVGPSLQTSIFGDSNFEVKTNDETQTVGMIRRESGHFSVHFPLDLDVKLKTVLIGASFFLDSLIYSKRVYVSQPRSNSS